jgi:hypothetical protein
MPGRAVSRVVITVHPMIPYTERDAELNLRPPYRMSGVEGLAAVRAIPRGEAQGWVDETLNWRPPGTAVDGRFVALPLAFVVFLKIARMESLDPGDAGRPALAESELSVVLPLVEVVPGRLPDFGSLAFYPVLLCLDSSPALISGREVFGFPKIGGAITIGPDGAEARCEVSGGRDRRLLALERAGGVAAGGDGGGPALAEMLHEALGGDDEETGRGPWGELGEALGTWAAKALAAAAGAQDFVFLKQFRDIAEPRAACYRAVASAALRFTAIRSARRAAGDWTLDVPPHASSSLLARLGLRSGPIGRPLRLDFDFELSLGRKIWST